MYLKKMPSINYSRTIYRIEYFSGSSEQPPPTGINEENNVEILEIIDEDSVDISKLKVLLL